MKTMQLPRIVSNQRPEEHLYLHWKTCRRLLEDASFGIEKDISGKQAK